MKKLGFGCMRLPLTDRNDPKSIDKDAFCGFIDIFMEKGFTYFDTAYFYHGGASENYVKSCLVERYPRESFVLATKLPLANIESAEDARAKFAEQFEKCGVDYFDYYLLHNVNDAHYKKALDHNCIELVRQAKEEGKIKRLGFSFHGGPELLEKVFSTHPEFEFVQLQINYLDWEDGTVQARRCYEIARSFGKEVIVMEPCKGGELSTVPDKAEELMRSVRPDSSPSSWAFRFAANLEGVIMVLSGMNSNEQVLENTALFDSMEPLSDEERGILAKTVDIISEVATIKCTACRYCVDGCPMNIPIPDCFGSYNRFLRTGLDNIKNNYAFNTRGKGNASACIECGQCVSACPQNLNIPELLKDVAKLFD